MDIKKQIEEMSEKLTSTEQRIVAALLADYPFAGLQPINDFAASTQTSSPTVSRFVTKLGFSGFQEFQRQLIVELKEGQRSPVEVKSTSAPVEGAYLSGFLGRVEQLVGQTKSSVSEAQFSRVCKQLADPSKKVFIIGNRMSAPIASFAYRHLSQIRTKVFYISSDPEEWPEYLLQMRAKDVLLVVDFRRYQKNLSNLAKLAKTDRGAQVILMTDQWFSPVASWSREVLALPITIGTFWDCHASAFAVTEAILTYVAESDWDRTKSRIEAWDTCKSGVSEPSEDN